MLKKRVVLMVVAMLCMFSVTASALGPLGVPSAQMDEHEYRVGLDYGYSEHNMTHDFLGENITFRTNAFLANLAYGVADNIEVYALAGIADGREFGGPIAFDAGFDFAYGVGTRITLFDYAEMEWGLVSQMTWFDVDDTVDGISEEVDGFEVKLGAGPSYTAMEGLQIYGGPMLHVINAQWSEPGISTDYNDRELGVFLGAQYEIMDNVSLQGEYQWTADLDMVGISVACRF